jgi:uncharacterized protein YecE (DUF72 family)
MNMHLSRQLDLFVSETGLMENPKPDKEAIARIPLYIGCAGWSLASSVQHNFPAQGTHLERYSRVLSAVEINSSFYRPHRAASYARWRDSVPDTFRFSVKVPRSITHQSRLQNARSELLQFLDAASNLKHKLGCLLVQLPPSLRFVPSIARGFFSELRSVVEADIVCEPRHLTWAAPEAEEILDQFRIARVAADPPAVPMPASASYMKTVYVRLHGAPVIYHSVYSDEQLNRLAMELANHIKSGRRVWCILDNTASGAAIPNALSLVAQFNAKAKLLA